MPECTLAQMNIGSSASEPTGRKSRGKISGRFSALPGSEMNNESAGANKV